MASGNWTDIVVCPACEARLSETETALDCREHGERYDIIDGIPLLMQSGTPDTVLDVETYSRLASVAPQAVENTFRQFQHALDTVGKSLKGSLLEIGAGTGLLTEPCSGM